MSARGVPKLNYLFLVSWYFFYGRECSAPMAKQSLLWESLSRHKGITYYNKSGSEDSRYLQITFFLMGKRSELLYHASSFREGHCLLAAENLLWFKTLVHFEVQFDYMVLMYSSWLILQQNHSTHTHTHQSNKISLKFL